MEDADLPKALIKRIAKAKLAQLDQAAGKTPAREVQISKDALLALAESARVFINYLTATGNDICKEAKRQIISVDDVLTALEDLEFSEILPPLKDSLSVFKADSKEKSKKKAEQLKKRKLEDQAAAEKAIAEDAANPASQPPVAHDTAGTAQGPETTNLQAVESAPVVQQSIGVDSAMPAVATPLEAMAAEEPPANS